MRDLLALTAGLAEPAIHAVLVEAPSKSHFGGSPNLPAGMEGPTWKGKRLLFLARLSLKELHRVLEIEWLPRTGALLFFYPMDEGEEPWGYDPADRGFCSVLHVPDLKESVGNQTATLSDESLDQRSIAFRLIETRPYWEEDAIRALSLSESEFDEYLRLLDAPYSGLPRHQVAGLPSLIQGEGMEVVCQLASNGVYCGTFEAYNGPEAEALKPGAKNWKLLFQIDTDDDLGVLWGNDDYGTLYFWVQETEARSGRFSNAWALLQY